jgi:hypothetical protein
MKKIAFTWICLILFGCMQPKTGNGYKGGDFFIPVLKTNNPVVNRAFRIAIGDYFSNIQPYKIAVADTSAPVILAGLNYDRPWTRDASINSWNGGSFITPAIARNTFMSVLISDNGKLRIGGQYWDAVVWVSGAWNHYLITGDREFLKLAYEVTDNSLAYFEETEFNSSYNLFRGLGWSDGVAAYEGKYANTGGSSGAHYWPRYNTEKVSKPGFGIPMMALSTNCLYYNAYTLAAKMAGELHEDKSDWTRKAGNLKEAINKYLWSDSTGIYKFYIDEEEQSYLQETLGNAYAILFGIADESKAESIFQNQHVCPAGVPCGWPPLKRYRTDSLSYARHNAVVWPQIQGFWAEAAARYDKSEMLYHEIYSLAKHAVRDMQFVEIYHPVTGEKYGGIQERNGKYVLWEATNRQTWAATGFIRMILYGVLGIRIDEKGIVFDPCIPKDLNEIVLSNLRYRNMLLQVKVLGAGTNIEKIFIDGKSSESPEIPNTLRGNHSIEIIVN